jgi:hypothetical protein
MSMPASGRMLMGLPWGSTTRPMDFSLPPPVAELPLVTSAIVTSATYRRILPATHRELAAARSALGESLLVRRHSEFEREEQVGGPTNPHDPEI